MKHITQVSMIVISDDEIADVNQLVHRNGYESNLVAVTYEELSSWDTEALTEALADIDAAAG